MKDTQRDQNHVGRAICRSNAIRNSSTPLMQCEVFYNPAPPFSCPLMEPLLLKSKNSISEQHKEHFYNSLNMPLTVYSAALDMIHQSPVYDDLLQCQ